MDAGQIVGICSCRNCAPGAECVEDCGILKYREVLWVMDHSKFIYNLTDAIGIVGATR